MRGAAKRRPEGAKKPSEARGARTRPEARGPVLQSRSLAVQDALAAVEACYRRGWTDGLPVIPPTEAAIRALLRGAAVAPDQVLGQIRSMPVTAEKVAINAVMAGCLPAHFPIVLAAVRGILDPRFGLAATGASTQSAMTVVIVNGPVVASAVEGKGLPAPSPSSRIPAGRDWISECDS